MGVILALAYSAWAVYSGYKVVSGHSEWLDADGTVNKIVKFFIAAMVGMLIGGFYLIYWVSLFFK